MSTLSVLLQYLLPHHALSRFTALFAESALLKNLLIGSFIRRYRVDLADALVTDPKAFENFNDFFTRELKPGARPLPEGSDAVVSPADGTVSQAGTISGKVLLQAKGRFFELAELLGGNTALAEQFHDGSFATIYLSPRDYHRVHMPLAGRLEKMIYVPGRLFSVNPRTTEKVSGLFARNERVVCVFHTAAGPMAVIMVGAMIVAGIETVWSGTVCPSSGTRIIRETDFDNRSPPIELAMGAEMGRFKLGSTAIVLFGAGAVELVSEIKAEAAVQMGQPLGKVRDA
ncbi:MAG: archaetidylserine decarboxylase [Proteobacteria bacterium]|nr:archaetidylserine decarboxylase [Pseudomonadota bacterium]